MIEILIASAVLTPLLWDGIKSVGKDVAKDKLKKLFQDSEVLKAWNAACEEVGKKFPTLFPEYIDDALREHPDPNETKKLDDAVVSVFNEADFPQPEDLKRLLVEAWNARKAALAGQNLARFFEIQENEALPILQRLATAFFVELARNSRFAFPDLVRKVGKLHKALPSSCYPFDLIEESGIFGQKDNSAAFAPAEEEYLANHVHRPHLADEVEARLRRSGWALVRGVGSPGKTVLAAHIGLARKALRFPAYYLDLAESEDAGSLDVKSALDVVALRACADVLFIVDNVHLDERTAAKIFARWNKRPNGSQILLLGRLILKGPDPKGRASPLSKLDDERLILETQPNDLRGVFRRLWLRLKPGLSLPPPSRQLAVTVAPPVCCRPLRLRRCRDKEDQ